MACQKRKAAPVNVAVPDVAAEQGHVNEDPNGLSPTLYFVPVLNSKKIECRGDDVKSIKNAKGQTIARVCEADYKVCVMQGTCLLSENRGMRIVTFTTRRGKVPTFSENSKKECPYGLGVKDICLDPYYTVAADLNFHKLGDVIFIPSVRGVQLPNGEIHDGYFVVRDSGSAIKSEKRFDFFTGFDKDTDTSNVFKKLGLDAKENRFKHEKASEEIAVKVRAKRNYPKINKKQLAEANAFIKSAMAR
tara:strand:+ start:59182 stop:59922 length:741 start_codon:yes stop_codon:yes gene_type:complete